MPADESGAKYLDQFLGLSLQRRQDALRTQVRITARSAGRGRPLQ